jgi:hypothetical protein
MSKKGIGFFEANNFFPDFILWLVVGKKQYVSFIDPKGLRQIQGFSDPKIELHKTIKNTIESKTCIVYGYYQLLIIVDNSNS